MLTINSRVRFLNQTGEGTIIAIHGDKYTVRDTDGFEYDVPSSEVVCVSHNAADELQMIDRTMHKQHEKGREERKKNIDKKTGGKGIRTLEVDLHQDALCPGNHNMSAIEIHELQKRTIVSTLNQERNHHGKQIVFIHGKGDGTLRRELIAELKKRQAECTYEDASFSSYGIQGAIKVTIK